MGCRFRKCRKLHQARQEHDSPPNVRCRIDDNRFFEIFVEDKCDAIHERDANEEIDKIINRFVDRRDKNGFWAALEKGRLFFTTSQNEINKQTWQFRLPLKLTSRLVF